MVDISDSGSIRFSCVLEEVCKGRPAGAEPQVSELRFIHVPWEISTTANQ